MVANVENSVDRQPLDKFFNLLRRGWWIVLLCSAAAIISVFSILSISDSRYQSIALMQSWNIPETREFISPAELEIRINSPDLMRLAKVNYAADSDDEDSEDLVDPVVRVSWVSGSSALRFVATGSTPEATRGILLEALLLLIESVRPNEAAMSRIQQQAAELEKSLEDLRLLTAAHIDQQNNFADRGSMMNSLIPALRLANLRALFSEIYRVSAALSNVNRYSFAPTADDIIQSPTLANSPLPSRALSTSLLAGIFTMLLGAALLLLISVFSKRQYRNELQDDG